MEIINIIKRLEETVNCVKSIRKLSFIKKDITYFEKKLNKVEDIFTYFNITKEFFYSLVEKENAELALLIIIYKALNDGWIPDFNNEAPK